MLLISASELMTLSSSFVSQLIDSVWMWRGDSGSVFELRRVLCQGIERQCAMSEWRVIEAIPQP